MQDVCFVFFALDVFFKSVTPPIEQHPSTVRSVIVGTAHNA